MPIYEYRCELCGEHLEILQQISDQPLRDCPQCGRAALQKLISAGGFRLAGRGWYETDFKTKNQRNLATTPDPKGAATQSKDTSKAADSSAKHATNTPNPTAKSPASSKTTPTAD